MRYHVVPAQLRGRGASGWLTLERSLGLGFGDWDEFFSAGAAIEMVQKSAFYFKYDGAL